MCPLCLLPERAYTLIRPTYRLEAIPIAFGTDPSFRAPMAIVVIGGLITSTFLSLLVVPVVYTLVDDGIERMRRLLGRAERHVAS
ncbi:efflux RND transporter permease subunit [Allochromatium vinosum]|uniref:efflux RND transporter permease subunit n=1 Tax=Allochromatium vinosum TaxID=1049 RepID=UPI00237BB91A|nr:efflux RND transporter permease subunit [Allochromatium vinosum]